MKELSFIQVQYIDIFDTFCHADVIYDLDLSTITWGASSVSLYTILHLLKEIERHKDSSEAVALAGEIRSFIEEWGSDVLVGL